VLDDLPPKVLPDRSRVDRLRFALASLVVAEGVFFQRGHRALLSADDRKRLVAPGASGPRDILQRLAGIASESYSPPDDAVAGDYRDAVRLVAAARDLVGFGTADLPRSGERLSQLHRESRNFKRNMGRDRGVPERKFCQVRDMARGLRNFVGMSTNFKLILRDMGWLDDGDTGGSSGSGPQAPRQGAPMDQRRRWAAGSAAYELCDRAEEVSDAELPKLIEALGRALAPEESAQFVSEVAQHLEHIASEYEDPVARRVLAGLRGSHPWTGSWWRRAHDFLVRPWAAALVLGAAAVAAVLLIRAPDGGEDPLRPRGAEVDVELYVNTRLCAADRQRPAAEPDCAWEPGSETLDFHYRVASTSRASHAALVMVDAVGDRTIVERASVAPTDDRADCPRGWCPLTGGSFGAPPGRLRAYVVLSAEALSDEALRAVPRDAGEAGVRVFSFRLEVSGPKP
jgi:hypothetical protein